MPQATQLSNVSRWKIPRHPDASGARGKHSACFDSRHIAHHPYLADAGE